MSLHKLTEIIKKIFIGIGIGVGTMLIITIFFRLGIFIKDLIFPQQAKPPTQTFGNLPAIKFPQSNINTADFTYRLDNVTGTLPTDFPDRLNIYKIPEKSPSFLNLNKAREKATALGFVTQEGKVVPEISLGGGIYQWNELTGINRKIKFDTLTFDFSLKSDYLASLTVLSAQNLGDENNAIATVKDFLSRIELFSDDIDITKTQTPQSDSSYTTSPKLYTIRSGVLFPTSSLSGAKVIRVDLYQNDIKYDLDTGKKENPKLAMQLPILYPNPPFSTMSFWIASGQNKAEVGASEFVHQDTSFISNAQPATYPIKTPEEAFEELKSGKAYASYLGVNKDIPINKVFLAYYLGSEHMEYLMPIIVFEGPNDFFAYVSAVKDEWISPATE